MKSSRSSFWTRRVAQLVVCIATAHFSLDLYAADYVEGKEAMPSITVDGRQDSVEGEATDRIFVKKAQTVRLDLTLPEIDSAQEVSISAPDGGTLVRPDGGKMKFTSGKKSVIKFEFTPTLGPGAYSVTVRQGGKTTTLDIWAGPRPPVGRPGPAYSPSKK